jgi:hypothetical protein
LAAVNIACHHSGRRDRPGEQKGKKVVLVLLFAAPATMGIVCAAVCLLLRRLIVRRTAIGSLAIFIAATGAGFGIATATMHWQGYRLSALQPIYDFAQREFLEVVGWRNKLDRSDQPRHTLAEVTGG